MMIFTKIKKVIDLVKFYIKYPFSLRMSVSKLVNKPKIKTLGLTYMDPNYIFFNRFTKDSVAFDIGCGYEAEFAQYLVKNFNVTVYAVDPTKKHALSLQKIQDIYGGKFIYLQNALSTKEEEIEFYETAEHESGSLLTDHVNIKNDTIQSYQVKTITLQKLPEICGKSAIDFVKIDIEGIEFTLFQNIDIEILKPFKQIFIEFHHYSVDSYSRKDTLKIIKRLQSAGFNYFSLDQVNYLFYW